MVGQVFFAWIFVIQIQGIIVQGMFDINDKFYFIMKFLFIGYKLCDLQFCLCFIDEKRDYVGFADQSDVMLGVRVQGCKGDDVVLEWVVILFFECGNDVNSGLGVA